jgi:hypothetical protein
MIISIYILGIFITVLTLAGLVALLLRRRNNSYELIIVRDNRRNSLLSGKIKYNLRYGSIGNLRAVKIYNSLLSFLPVRTLTEIADPRPFLWYGRTVVGIIGPTGTPEDDTIILVKPPIITDLDIQHNAEQQSEALAAAWQSFRPDDKKPLEKQIQDFIKSTFTKQWVIKELGPQNLIDKDDVIPRSQKVAYTSEIEHSYELEVKHQGGWAKLAAMAPAIIVVILLIGAGIFFYEMYNAQSQYMHSLTQDEGMLTSYAQSMSVGVGQALAKVGVYGYNASIPTAPSLKTNTSIMPSIPNVKT